jgi:Holliday junction resolvase RusA-like endonuclease
MIRLVIPGIPPSANHYKGINRRTGRWYVRKPAIGFKADVANLYRDALAKGMKPLPDAKAYLVEVIVYLPKGKRGDADNFNKVPLDALQAAGVFPNDSRGKRVIAEVDRDWSNPRTEITVSVYDKNAKQNKG